MAPSPITTQACGDRLNAIRRNFRRAPPPARAAGAGRPVPGCRTPRWSTSACGGPWTCPGTGGGSCLPRTLRRAGAGHGVGQQVHRVTGDGGEQGRAFGGVAGERPGPGAVGGAYGPDAGGRGRGQCVDAVQGPGGGASLQLRAEQFVDVRAYFGEVVEPRVVHGVQGRVVGYEPSAHQPLPQASRVAQLLGGVRARRHQVQADRPETNRNPRVPVCAAMGLSPPRGHRWVPSPSHPECPAFRPAGTPPTGAGCAGRACGRATRR